MRILHDHFGRIAGVVHQNFLRGDQDVHGMTIGFDIECAVGRELQQIHAGEIAGGVVEEHVLAAGIACIDARGVLRSVPAVDGGVVLHAGIAASPGGVGNFEEQVFGFESLHGPAIANGAGGEVGVAQDGIHEVVSDAYGVIGVLKENGAVGVGVGRRTVVSCFNQGVCLGLFFRFALDEVNDVWMISVQDDHLG